ncbi:sortase [Candidatus Dojkabacteria bacterium]|nr:sortase [Candidatus Dojkabacteria bacterium]
MNKEDPIPKKNKSSKILRRLKGILNLYTLIGFVFWILATIFIFIPYFPHIWYRLNANAIDSEVDSITSPAENSSDPGSFSNRINDNPEEKVELPEFDKDLPKDNMLIIDKIGVNGIIQEGIDAEAILETGLWRVNDFGTPEDGNTIIIAAHRFGYIYWTNEFRKTNSFYNLPQTTVGDRIYIIWNQRRYEYEIYKAEDSTEINDYNADLILYTCRMFNSPVRVFRYAKRVN